MMVDFCWISIPGLLLFGDSFFVLCVSLVLFWLSGCLMFGILFGYVRTMELCSSSMEKARWITTFPALVG